MAHHDTQAQPTGQPQTAPTARTARPGASWWVPERLEPALVALGVGECQGCKLHACGADGAVTQGVPGTGSVPAPVVLVGADPPLCREGDGGLARLVLRQALEQAGLDADATWSTYVVKHAAPDCRPGADLDAPHHPDHVLLVGDPHDALDDDGRPLPSQVEALAVDLRAAAAE